MPTNSLSRTAPTSFTCFPNAKSLSCSKLAGLSLHACSVSLLILKSRSAWFLNATARMVSVPSSRKKLMMGAYICCTVPCSGQRVLLPSG